MRMIRPAEGYDHMKQTFSSGISHSARTSQRCRPNPYWRADMRVSHLLQTSTKGCNYMRVGPRRMTLPWPKYQTVSTRFAVSLMLSSTDPCEQASPCDLLVKTRIQYLILTISQSSQPTLRVTAARVNSRTATASVPNVRQIVCSMMTCFEWSGGLSKFGMIPGGGGAAPMTMVPPDMVVCFLRIQET